MVLGALSLSFDSLLRERWLFFFYKFIKLIKGRDILVPSALGGQEEF
jgi:hypothetical protein